MYLSQGGKEQDITYILSTLAFTLPLIKHILTSFACESLLSKWPCSECMYSDKQTHVQLDPT